MTPETRSVNTRIAAGMTHAQLAARAGPGAVTVTTPSGHAVPPIAPAALADALGWSLERLDTALAALTEHLAGTGIRIDTDPAPPGTPVRGLRARDRHLSDGQRTALHRLRNTDTPLDADTARVLYAAAHPRGTLTEGDAPDPAIVSPSSSAGSSAAVPAPATSSSPTTPGSPSRQSQSQRQMPTDIQAAPSTANLSVAAVTFSRAFHCHLGVASHLDRTLTSKCHRRALWCPGQGRKLSHSCIKKDDLGPRALRAAVKPPPPHRERRNRHPC